MFLASIVSSLGVGWAPLSFVRENGELLLVINTQGKCEGSPSLASAPSRKIDVEMKERRKVLEVVIGSITIVL